MEVPTLPENAVSSTETLFLSLAHSRVEIAAWMEGERPRSSLGYTTPAASPAKLDKQWHILS
jgi:putative transposase